MIDNNMKLIDAISKMSKQEVILFLDKHSKIKLTCDLSKFDNNSILLYAFLTCGYGYGHELTLSYKSKHSMDKELYTITNKNCPKSFDEFLSIYNKYNGPAIGVAAFDKNDTNRYSISTGFNLGNQLAIYNDDEKTLSAAQKLATAIIKAYDRTAYLMRLYTN